MKLFNPLNNNFLVYRAHLNVFLAGIVLVTFTGLTGRKVYEAQEIKTREITGTLTAVTPNLQFGLGLDTFQIREFEISKDMSFPGILQKMHIDAGCQQTIINTAIEAGFTLDKFYAGKDIKLLHNLHSGEPEYLIYEPDKTCYLKVDLNNLSKTEFSKHAITTQRREECITMNGNIWQSFIDAGINPELAVLVEDAFECVIDFHHLEEGASFKLIFDESKANGEYISAGNLIAASIKHGEKVHNAFKYAIDGKEGYYDGEGRPMKRYFLKSPLRFFTITSGFSKSRFHPILRYNRPHFGTDFAAPTGTPIHSVADGVISQATYGGGNGKFVKIRHDHQYETQYLHMSRFAKGIRPGVRVSQGQVIGYVGSTGLATGPHVCFRFWKNGQQVNFLRQNVIIPPKPMAKQHIPSYKNFVNQMLQQLDSLKIEPKAKLPGA